MPEYPEPVARLLSYRTGDFREDWPDYPTEFGLGPEHVPDLIRLGTDPECYREDAGELEAFAPIHARRTLGQLKAVEAVGPLLRGMTEFGDLDDFWSEELPTILAMLGPDAIPAITEGLADRSLDEYSRIACSRGLREIAGRHPETREETIGRLTRQLALKEEGAEALNGFLVSDLVDLEAEESAPVIEGAFAAGVVDEMIMGDWPQVRYDLGLGPKPERPRYHTFGLPADLGGSGPRSRPDLKKLAKKRKAEKQARKRNRKRR